MDKIGKLIIELGVIFIVIGVLFVLFDRVPLFRLPGDIVIKREHFTLYIPIVTSIVLSILLTIILNIIFRNR